MNKTEQFIKDHQKKVKKRIDLIVEELNRRAATHDLSKLQEPEFSAWCEMDKEPHYAYDDPKYMEKKKRWEWLFEEHYRNSKNRHHPEHWSGFYNDMDLVDLIEMLCDWASFMSFTSEEAPLYLEKQIDRFQFDNTIKDLLLNTFRNYFTVTESDKMMETLMGPIDFKELKKNFG